MTNARYIIARNIQNISGRYNISFRINNTETNEIKTTFNEAYSISDIETGLAAKEAVKELLGGMGVILTEAGARALLTVQAVEAKATTQLAKGMVAAKSDNIVESLAFLTEALDSNSTRAEANRNIQSFFIAIPTGTITQRANFAIEQKAKWDKIFADLEIYILRNLPVFIYDFSVVEDRIDIKSNSVSLTIRPGIKIIPDRKALSVYKTIADNWRQISGMPENRDWARSIKMPNLTNYVGGSNAGWCNFLYNISVRLYDDYGDRVADAHVGRPELMLVQARFPTDIQVSSQQRYYEDSRFREITFYNIPLNRVTDKMTPRIDSISAEYIVYKNGPKAQFSAKTVAEYQEWLRSQGNAR